MRDPQRKRNAKYIILFFIIIAVTITFSVSGTNVNRPKSLKMTLTVPFQPFAKDSPWNVSIPDNPVIDSFSDQMMARLQTTITRIEASTRKWTVPIFFIDSELSPRVDIPSSGLLFETIDPDNTGIARNIPMPDGIWSDPEADGHMVLVDPVKALSWEFTRARKGPDGKWTASIIDRWDLKGLGFRQPFTGQNWWRSGAMGAGMPLIAGIIRPEEVKAGEIRHALLCATPINRKSTYQGGGDQVCSPPASRTDGYGIGIDFIPEGARIQLDPDLDLDTLNLSPGTLVIARAMQRYGMFVGISSPTFKIFCQNMGPDNHIWDTYSHFDDLARIPLDRFRILACDYVAKQ